MGGFIISMLVTFGGFGLFALFYWLYDRDPEEPFWFVIAYDIGALMSVIGCGGMVVYVIKMLFDLIM
jgi:hypothetical protein